MGRLDEARDVIKGLRIMTSVLIPTATHWRDQQLRELYLEGLRLAAGELTSPRQPNGAKDRVDHLPEDRQGARIEDPATAARPRR
jgi:hypothetical protein